MRFVGGPHRIIQEVDQRESSERLFKGPLVCWNAGGFLLACRARAYAIRTLGFMPWCMDTHGQHTRSTRRQAPYRGSGPILGDSERACFVAKGNGCIYIYMYSRFGPRCVFVFVCVCVCLRVYSRVGASYAGRPICVCAVSGTLRRVNTHIYISKNINILSPYYTNEAI